MEYDRWVQIMIHLGTKLKTLRQQNNMTQLDLANKIGASKSVVCAYENGSRRPSFEILIKLARLFNVTTDYLLGVEQKSAVDLSGLTSDERIALQQLIHAMRKKQERTE